MREVTKNWDEFWAEVIGIKIYDNVKKAERYAEFQVRHIIQTLNLQKGDFVLDLACGAGFHAISLAKKGIKVTGVDISKTLIQYAQKYAREKGVSIKFIHQDMRNIHFNEDFDAVVTLNQSFGIFDDEGNLIVLKNIRDALRKKGKFYIQTLNPLFDGKWRNTLEWARKDDGYWLLESKYNPYTGRIEGDDIYIRDDGVIIKNDNAEVIHTRSIRLYTLPELSKLVSAAGMEIKKVYGSQNIPLEEYTYSSPDMIIVGEKDE